MSTTVPTTPRNRVPIGIYRSPTSTPSLSASKPFDWDAALSGKPPPYPSPLQHKRAKMSRKSVGVGTPKRVVRKKGIVEKITALPSRIAFEIAVFPNNVPLPAPKTSAWLIGGTLHFLHLCVRVNHVRQVPQSDLGWEDMYREGEGEPWFDWTVPVSLFLVIASVLNTVHLFSQIKLYRMHHRQDPVSSPNAAFVSSNLDTRPLVPPPLASRVLSGLWYVLSSLGRFLLGMGPRANKAAMLGKKEMVQQLNVWNPGEFESRLFCVYSPAHSLLWMASNSANWMLTMAIMAIVGVQLHFMTRSFEILLKDKEIIAAEVLREYNQGFVYPRILPIRKDVAVMTHQSEVVNVWQ